MADFIDSINNIDSEEEDDDESHDEEYTTTTTTTTNQPKYWCHQCKKHVNLANPEEYACPICSSEFIEEIETPATPVPPPTQTSSTTTRRTNRFTFGGGNNPFLSGRAMSNNEINAMDPMQMLAQLFPQPTGGNNGSIRSNVFFQQRTNDPNNVNAQPAEFDQVLFGLNQMLNSLGGGGFSLGNGIGIGIGGGNGFVGNPNDYYQGGDWQEFLNRMFQASMKKGTPPASKNEINNLKRDRVDQSIVDLKTECAVCKDEFKWGDDYIELPCLHQYHPDCILPWLEHHNSCPVCRYELKTDDASYENDKKEREEHQARQQAQQAQQQAQDNITDNPNTTTTTTTTSTSQPNDNNHHNDEQMDTD